MMGHRGHFQPIMSFGVPKNKDLQDFPNSDFPDPDYPDSVFSKVSARLSLTLFVTLFIDCVNET